MAYLKNDVFLTCADTQASKQFILARLFSTRKRIKFYQKRRRQESQPVQIVGRTHQASAMRDTPF
jgi:hypothetical protein